MSQTVVTDQGLLVIPGGDPPELPPTITDQLLFPEGEVAPTEVAPDLLPPENMVCINCERIRRDAEPGARIAVDCGKHDWIERWAL